MIAIGLLLVRMLCDYFKSRPQLLRRGLPTEDIVGAYGMAMRKSSRAGFVPPGRSTPGLGHPQPFPLDAGDEWRDAGKFGRRVNRGRDPRNGVPKQLKLGMQRNGTLAALAH